MKNVLWIGLAISTGLFAQGPGGRMGRGGFFGPGGPGGPQRTVTGAPYSAVEVTTSQRVLANGNVISNQRQTNLYRDSQGRMRTETTVSNRPGNRQSNASQTPRTIVSIHDPVAGVNRTIDDTNRVVHETSVRPQFRGNNTAAPANRPRWNGQQRPADPNVKTEDLGIQTVSGVTAHGTRITRTIPAGAMGNAQPIQTVREVWTSTDLKVDVLTKVTDPRSGTTVTQLTNINRAEPDPSLFQAPAGYTVQHGPARPMGRGRVNQ
ncbi:MAG TPA: hypothetical protein VML19_18460 [Verrucomicrobiae bacterium]|nr:hypothetical protein [Verrucomicrobiae bacterium]